MRKKRHPPAARGAQLDLPGLKWPDVSIDLALPALDLDPLAAVEFVELPKIDLDSLPGPQFNAAGRQRPRPAARPRRRK